MFVGHNPIFRCAQWVNYLAQAITMKSVSQDNLERLEFLGDTWLKHIVRSTLMDKYVTPW
jgi:dsRNA-specific ribonuclease